MVAGKLSNNYLATTNSNNTHHIHVEQMMQWDQLVRVKKVTKIKTGQSLSALLCLAKTIQMGFMLNYIQGLL